ncbi:hypothetical protein DRQ09_04315, partial [candidate division KSB1 bacterium]
MIKKIITGKLKALTGIYIGSGDFSEVTGSLVYRNVNGKVVIPGTSIAGTLRTLATKLAPHLGFTKCVTLQEKMNDNECKCAVCGLFGSISQSDESEGGTASKLWVNNAILENDIKISIRDGVGIDRETKSSSRAMRAKYDLEVIPKDAEFTFQISLQEGVTDEQEKLLAAVLKEWCEGRGYVGGNLSRGLGNVQLIDLRVFTIELSSIAKLMTFLKKEDPVKSAFEEEKWIENKVNEASMLIKFNE